MIDEILEAWRTNQRIDLLLLAKIDDEGLGDTLSTRGGRSVARQLAHVHNVRLMHLQKRGRGMHEGLRKFETREEPTREEIEGALVASGERVERFLVAIHEGKARGMKKGLPTFLSYLVAHESHHRGNILLTLKQCGHAIDKDSRYAIWDWDRR